MYFSSSQIFSEVPPLVHTTIASKLHWILFKTLYIPPGKREIKIQIDEKKYSPNHLQPHTLERTDYEYAYMPCKNGCIDMVS